MKYMDIEEIITEAIKATAVSFTKEERGFPEIEDEKMRDMVNANKPLIAYTQKLLIAYHENLKATLAKQGIKI